MSGGFTYCPRCAGTLEPFDDQGIERRRCPGCGWIHYRNPTAGVAVIILRDEEILLGERRGGGWCIPCGHVEWDETIEEAAHREMLEETGLEVVLLGVFAVHSNVHDPEQHTVGVWYAGEARGGALRAGGDLVRVDFHALDALPEISFPSDRLVLRELAEEFSGGDLPPADR
jgi:ADP-ribose pyrophosphatase YjhB (NUDIX family)